MKYLLILLIMAVSVQVNAQTNHFYVIAEQAAKETDQKLNGLQPVISLNIRTPESGIAKAYDNYKQSTKQKPEPFTDYSTGALAAVIILLCTMFTITVIKASNQ